MNSTKMTSQFPTNDNQASRNHDNVDVLKCPICLQSFLCKYGLDAHFVSHKSDVARCAICKLEFSSPPHVYVHYLQTHFNRFLLPEFENQRKKLRLKLDPDSDALQGVGFLDLDFASFSNEKFNLVAKVYCEKNKRHASEDRNECTKCERSFPSAAALKLHLETHPGFIDVTCDACDVTFATKSAYEEHLLQHADEQVRDACCKMAAADCDVMEKVSKPEFLLCVGLRSKTDTTSWCNANAVERSVKKIEHTQHRQKQQQQQQQQQQQRYNNTTKQHTTTTVTPTNNNIQPIVIQPLSDATVPRVTSSAEKLRVPHQMFPSSQPLNTQRAALQQLFSTLGIFQKVAPQAAEVVTTSGTDNDFADRVKPYQCIICEFAFCSKRECEDHCRCVQSCDVIHCMYYNYMHT